MQGVTRLVALPCADVAMIVPPVSMDLSPLPMSPEDPLETFVDVFVAMLKLDKSQAASAGCVHKVAQLCSGLRLMAKSLAQCMRFHRVELNPQVSEAQAMLITAANNGINDLLADVAALGKHAQRGAHEQPPVRVKVPDAPDLAFTTLCLLLDES